MLLEDDSAIHKAICDLNRPVYVVQDQNQKHIVADQGKAIIGPEEETETDSLPLAGFSPVSSPRQLGDISFCEDHDLRFPYMCGAMANGIASIELVVAATNAGLLASFGAAGLTQCRFTCFIWCGWSDIARNRKCCEIFNRNTGVKTFLLQPDFLAQ